MHCSLCLCVCAALATLDSLYCSFSQILQTCRHGGTNTHRSQRWLGATQAFQTAVTQNLRHAFIMREVLFIAHKIMHVT